MRTSNVVGLAVVAVVLFLLAVLAVHLDPTLAGVISAILLGVAAIITAINRTGTTHHPEPDDIKPDDTEPDDTEP